MTGSANKPTPLPKTGRKRSQSLVVVKCDIANCGFSAKTTKTVQKHQREVHEVKPHNETTFNQSVSESILDATVDASAHGQTDSLEHKTSTDFFQEVACKQQSTQLASTGKKRANRGSEDGEEEEEEKRLKLSTAIEPELSQTQGELERQEARDKAKATVTRKIQEDPLDVSRSLLETSSAKPDDLDDNNSQEGDSLLLQTAQDTVTTPADSLSLSFMTSKDDTDYKDLEKQLKASDSSLKQALAKIANLEANEGVKVKKIEYLENKLSKKDKELTESTETITLLTEQIDKNDPKNKKFTTLNNKILALEKKLADAKADAAKFRENAETQRSITEGFKMVQADLSAQVVSLKRDTLCKDDNCTNKKECGRSHAHKEENRPQCDFFNVGRCKKGNECRFKHDVNTKQIYHDTEGKRKREEKEKEEKEKEEEKKKGEKKKKDEEDEEKKKKAKTDSKKEKMKRKRDNRKLRKTGNSTVTSTDMEVEDSTEEPEKKKKKTKVVASNSSNSNADSKPKPPPTSTTTSNMPPPSTHPLNPPQLIDLTKPPPPGGNFQPPQIPASFNFSQGPGLHNIPPNFTPNIHHNLTPMNMQPPTMGSFNGAQRWPVPVWPGHLEMTMERARQEEAQAQALSRRARLDSIRAEIASLQTRIIASQSQPQGTVDIQALIQQEAALKQHLFEQSY